MHLTDVRYDDVPVGQRKGPYVEHVSAELASRLAGPIGERRPVAVAPPAVFPALFLRALRRSLGGIPAAAILAKQELEFHAELPVDSDVHTTTWVGEKYVRRERPFVVVEFEVRDARDRLVVTGRKVLVWPSGPGEG